MGRNVFQRGVRECYRQVLKTLESLDSNNLKEKQKLASDLFIDNSSNEARTLHNQFGRLKSYIEFTDYHNLTNKQLEGVLYNTQKELEQFSVDFSKLFFSYT